MIFYEPLTYFIAICFCLVIVSYYDIRFRIIPNVLSIIILIIGIAYHIFNTVPNDLKYSIFGIVIGFVIFLFLYFIGMMGAGDVKLAGSVGAFLGLNIFNAMLVTILFGGFLALFYLLIWGLKKRSDNMQTGTFKIKSIGKQTIPYGVAISIGTIYTFLVQVLIG